MRENEFEKDIRNVMGAFMLSPSDEVWQKLEKDLKKKKRRRIFFFLLLLATLTGGSGAAYLVWKNKNTDTVFTDRGSLSIKDTNHRMESSKEKTPGAATNKIYTPIGQTDSGFILSDTSSNQSSNTNIVVQQIESLLNSQKVPDRKAATIIKNTLLAKYNSTIKNQQNLQGNRQAVIKENSSASQISKQDVVNSNPDTISHLAPGMSISDSITENERVTTKAIDSVQTDSHTVSDSAMVVNQVIEEKSVSTKKQSKIRWSAEIAAGITTSHHNPLTFKGPTAGSIYQNFSSSTTGSQRRVPSEVNPGAAFSMGINGELPLSKRSSVIAGVGYMYASDKIHIGDKISPGMPGANTANSISGIAYESGGSNTHTNRYHSVILPFQYQLQLIQHKKFTLLWNAGAVPSVLFSTNGLVYDTAANGVYYHNNELFQKWNIMLSTGVYFSLGDSKRNTWLIGPQLRFQTVSLIREEAIEPRRYLLYSGISAKVYFPKRK